MAESDMTDDWMNPPKWPQPSYVPANYPRHLIERRRKIDYAPFFRWDIWQVFKTRGERDEALTDLREKHPAWQLRARNELEAPRAYL